MELEVQPCKIENEIAIKGAATAIIYTYSPDFTLPCSDTSIGKTYILNSKSQSITFEDSNGDSYEYEWYGDETKSAYNFNYSITFDNLTYSFETAQSAGSSFKIRYAANGTNAVDANYYHCTKNKGVIQTEETEKLVYEATYNNVVQKAEGTSGAVCSLDTDGNMLLTVVMKPSSYELKEGEDKLPDYMNFKVSFLVTKIRLGTAGAGSLILDTDASDTAGETAVSVPAAIVVGLLGAVASIGAAGASAVGASTANASTDVVSDNDTPRAAYKMYIRKDFGDSIRYNDPQKTVYARMAELPPGGGEIDRPDLSANIMIFSDGSIDVEDCAMTGSYKGALVSCTTKTGANDPRKGVISFLFTGEGGTFQNNVTFRLVGNAYILFDGEKNGNKTVDMVYGDGGCYTAAFTLCDFMYPAEKITANIGNAPVTVESTKIDGQHYHLNITNNSRKPEGIAFKNEMFRIEVTAENDYESARDPLNVNLIPEGLSMRETSANIMRDGRFCIPCCDNPDTENTNDLPITRLGLALAVSKADERGIRHVERPDMRSVTLSFAEMTAESEKLVNAAHNAKCEFVKWENYATAGEIDWQICPKQQIPQDNSADYDVTLPISCEYGGQSYSLSLPIRLLGDQLLAQMQERQREIVLLKQRIKKYLDPDEVADFFALFDKKSQNMSAYDIRLKSLSIFNMAKYRVYDVQMYKLQADFFDWCDFSAGWVKWAGDSAFSLLIAKLAGPTAGPIVDSVLSPAKDIICEEIGEGIVQWYGGEEVTFFNGKKEKYEQKIFVVLENLMAKSITSKTDIKKVGGLLACFCIAKFCDYAIYGKNGKKLGYYDAIMATFGDLTAVSFKVFGLRYFEKYIGDPKNKDAIATKLNEWVNEKIGQLTTDESLFKNLFKDEHALSAQDVINKYLKETIALFGGWLYKKGSEAELSGTTITFNIKSNLPDGTEDKDLGIKADIPHSTYGIKIYKDFKQYGFKNDLSLFLDNNRELKICVDPLKSCALIANLCSHRR